MMRSQYILSFLPPCLVYSLPFYPTSWDRFTGMRVMEVFHRQNCMTPTTNKKQKTNKKKLLKNI